MIWYKTIFTWFLFSCLVLGRRNFGGPSERSHHRCKCGQRLRGASCRPPSVFVLVSELNSLISIESILFLYQWIEQNIPERKGEREDGFPLRLRVWLLFLCRTSLLASSSLFSSVSFWWTSTLCRSICTELFTLCPFAVGSTWFN